MRNRKLSKGDFQLLEKEVRYYTSQNIITKEQKEKILNLYEVSEGLNFIKVLVSIGSILVGIGILSFIASNWQVIGKVSKFLIIILSFCGVYYSGYYIKDKYPKTARSLIYISVLIYGSGIFLVGQTFNYGGDFTTAFLMWALGIIPISFVFKDKMILLFVHVLLLVYLNGYYRFYEIPYLIMGLIALLYYLNKYYDYSKLITFATNVLTINFVTYLCFLYNLEGVYTLGILLVLGLVMYYAPIEINRETFAIEGTIVIGVAGLILTVREVWNDLGYIENADAVSVIFAIIYIIYLLYLTQKGNLISLIFICITIFRYYFDTMYDFMPKSLFFIIGGLILLGFGYYFERMRRLKGDIIDED